MGYNTSYRLDLHGATKEQENRVRAFMDTGVMPGDDRTSGFTDEEQELIVPAFFHELEECKWYDHDEDMAAFSRKFPDVVFLLQGEGERPADLWKTYYRDGRAQVCEAVITFAPFDPDKLR